MQGFPSKIITVFFLFFLILFDSQAGRYNIPPLNKSFLVWNQAYREALPEKGFRVVVWNILKAKKRRYEREFASFGRNTDVFMLQEVSTVKDFFRGYRFFPDHEIHFGASFSYKRDRYLSGTAISSKVIPSDSGMIRSKELEPFVKTPKVVTWMKLPIQGQSDDLLLVNIHGLNMTKNRDFFKQMDACGALISEHSGPVIFAGDFNTSDYEKYNKMIEVIQKHRLVPVAFKNDKRKKSLFSRLVIDHAFVRDLQILKAEVHRDLKASDHKAMSMVLKPL